MNKATLMQDTLNPEHDRTGQLAKGWGLSIALHGCLILAVMSAMPKLTITLENEPFRWEVALVQAPATPSSTAAPAPPAPQPEPVKPVQAKQQEAKPQPVRPPETAPQAVTRPIQRQDMAVQHEIEPIQRESQPVQREIETVQRDMELVRRDAQSVQREFQQRVETEQQARGVEPAREVAAVERARIDTQEITKSARTTESVTTEPAREIASAVEQHVTQTTPVPLETRETSAPAAEHRIAETKPEPEVVARVPAMENPTPVPILEKPAPVETVTTSAPTPSTSMSPSPPVQEAVEPPPVPPVAPASDDSPAPAVQEQAPVVARSVTPSPARKADYGWLAESLHRRIVEVRQYPSVARLNGWEGKVVLRVQIRQDGHLDSVSVVKSSGHETLDNAAMEAVKLACPLHMKHELASPMVVVQVPINYSLNR
jgi:protein TonB